MLESKSSNSSFLDVRTRTHDVLRLLFEYGPQCQRDIAAKLGLTRAACSVHFCKLSEAGLIESVGAANSVHGRSSQVWQLKSGSYFLGLCFSDEGQKLSAAAVDFSGQPFFTRLAAIPAGVSVARLERLTLQLTREALAQIQAIHGNLLQTYVCTEGTPAPDGTVIHNPFLPAMDGRDFERLLAPLCGDNIFSDTQNPGAIHYLTDKLPTGSTALLVYWGRGIGNNVIANHEILNWAAIPANRNRGLWNFGHIPIVKNGRPCYCGRRGCLEAYVGGDALLADHPEFGCTTVEQLPSLARTAPEAQRVLQQAAKLLAENLYTEIELFGIDHILFQGPLANAFPLWKDAFLSGLETKYTPEEAALLHLQAVPDNTEAQRIGAALTARQFYFFPENLRRCRGVFKLGTPAVTPN